MAAWTRPVLALAASIAVVVWAGALLAGQARAPRTQRPSLFLDWAADDDATSAARLLEAFGDLDE
jgi:hypothetical protein